MAIRLEQGIWVVEGDTHRTEWIKKSGSLNIDVLINRICDLISEGDVVIDVGANIGDHTYFYRKAVGPTGRVIAFEPDAECFACCVLNCGTFEDMHMAAATRVRGNFQLVIEPNRGQNHLRLDSGSIIGVPLDSLKLERCDLIKIDVEGAELEVLHGALRLLDEHNPKIIVECVESQLNRFGASASDLWHFFEERNYESREIANDGRDILFFRP